MEKQNAFLKSQKCCLIKQGTMNNADFRRIKSVYCFALFFFCFLFFVFFFVVFFFFVVVVFLRVIDIQNEKVRNIV